MNRKPNSKKWSGIQLNERWAAATGRLLLLLLLTLSAVVQAQFNYTTTTGTITLTYPSCLGDAVTIPNTINDLPVTSIGNSAFYHLNPA